MNKRWKNHLLVISLLLLAAVLVLSGCSYSLGNSTNGNKILTVTKGLEKFSVEYNPIYKLDSVYVNKDGSTFVALTGPRVGKVQVYTLLMINFVKFKPGESGYQKFLEDELGIRSQGGGYKILDRFPVEVAGQSGEEVIYFESDIRNTIQIAQGLPPESITTKLLMFADNTGLWSFTMHGLEATVDSDGLNFDHIVQTFKIIN
jgi:hypothetical protein